MAAEAILMGTEPEIMPLDWEKGTPNRPGYKPIKSVIRLGLGLGLASAGLVVAEQLVQYTLTFEQHYALNKVFLGIGVVAITLGLAGNVAACTLLPRRQGWKCALGLIGVFAFYNFLYFGPIYEYSLSRELLLYGAWIFPYLGVSAWLRSRGWLPKAALGAAAVAGGYGVFIDLILYLNTIGQLAGGIPAWSGWIGLVAINALNFSWLGLWGHINARPALYLGRKNDE